MEENSNTSIHNFFYWLFMYYLCVRRKLFDVSLNLLARARLNSKIIYAIDKICSQGKEIESNNVGFASIGKNSLTEIFEQVMLVAYDDFLKYMPMGKNLNNNGCYKEDLQKAVKDWIQTLTVDPKWFLQFMDLLKKECICDSEYYAKILLAKANKQKDSNDNNEIRRSNSCPNFMMWSWESI